MSWNSRQIDHDPPATYTAMQRSIADYLFSNAPAREIDTAIIWLEEMARDCHYKISQLQSLKNDRERAAAQKNTLEGLAALFEDPDFENIDPDNQVRVIMQRLGCEWPRAAYIRDITIKRLKKSKILQRNCDIIKLHQSGISDIDIAAKVSLTRQQVYNIRNKKERR